MRTILGIQINDRSKAAVKVQDILTKYGCVINTRLGLHDAGDKCSDQGLVLLDVAKRGNEETLSYFADELEKIEGITVRRMEF